LISSLGVYAKVNGMGFIETPYRKVTNGVVDFNTNLFSAEEEEGMLISQIFRWTILEKLLPKT
jgi:DNA-directed RNA polymerase subunit beta